MADEQVVGPNPTRGGFIFPAPAATGGAITATVYDPSGRRVAIVRGLVGKPLVWDGRVDGGRRAGPGVYLYRVETQRGRSAGEVVVLR